MYFIYFVTEKCDKGVGEVLLGHDTYLWTDTFIYEQKTNEDHNGTLVSRLTHVFISRTLVIYSTPSLPASLQPEEWDDDHTLQSKCRLRWWQRRDVGGRSPLPTPQITARWVGGSGGLVHTQPGCQDEHCCGSAGAGAGDCPWSVENNYTFYQMVTSRKIELLRNLQFPHACHRIKNITSQYKD